MSRLARVVPILAGLALIVAGFSPQLRDAVRRHRAVERFRAKAEFHRQAQEWDLLRFRDPATGAIPASAEADEVRWLATLESGRSSSLAAATPVWTARGPFETGGRTRDLEVDVTDPRVLIAASVTGGLWRSEDGGLTWTPTLAPNQVHSAVSLAQDVRPGKTHIWYAGTGERIGSGHGVGNGIYQSTDGGRTWTTIYSTAGREEFVYVNAVAIDPTNATQDEIYAATEQGVYRSFNGGLFWTRVLAGYQGVWVEVARDGAVYAAMGLVEGGARSALFRSPDGIAWTEITPAGWPSPANATRIASAPSDPRQVHFFTESNFVTHLWKYTWLSGNGSGAGGSWTDRSAQMVPYLGTFNGYCMALAIGPNGPDDVYVGGQIPSHYSANAGRFVSIGSPAPHPDTHAFAFSPAIPNGVYVASDGGIDLADDGMYRFRPLNRGYVTTQFYGLGINPATLDDAVVGGTQDNWNWYAAPGDSARVVRGGTFGGDGGFAAILPDGEHVLVSSQGGVVLRRHLVTGVERAMYRYDGGSVMFINPFAVDPAAGYAMYYPTGGALWRTPDVRDDASFWTRLDGSHLGPEAISAIAVSTLAPAHRVYYGKWNGVVARVDGAMGAATAVNVTPPGALGRYVSSISVDPENGDRVLVTVSNYNTKSLYSSMDAGATWSEVGGNLDNVSGQIPGYQGPAVIASAILASPTGERLYFAGTSAGLFSTTRLDGASTVWKQEAANTIGNVEVNQIATRAADGLVAVATHGAGLWSAYFSPPVAGSPAAPARSLRLGTPWPQPFRESATIPFDLPAAGRARLEVFDAAGRRVAVLVDGQLPAGTHRARWSAGRAAPGHYHLRLFAGGIQRTARITRLR